MTEGARPPVVVVLEVARSSLRLVAISRDCRILTSRVAPNATRSGPPYPHLDVQHLWRWLVAALADYGERFTVQAIVPCADAASVALVDEAGELVLPIPDPACEIPPLVATGYAEVAPWFEECRAPLAPAARTLARQLYWLTRTYDAAAARARWILPLPQYLAFGLSGIAACELSALGAGTQLWNPAASSFTALVSAEGWAESLPGRREAHAVLGPLRADLAERALLPAGIPVLCGLDREAARRLRARRSAGAASLVTTGEWLVAYGPAGDLERLDPLRDTAAVLDPDGAVVRAARFLGGIEAEAIRGGRPEARAPQLADVAALVAAGTMAVPAFSRSGPFSRRAQKGRIRGHRPADARERAALADLYLALMADLLLELAGAGERVVVDAADPDHGLLAPLLGALGPMREILVLPEGEGGALGASLLWAPAAWPSSQPPAAVPVEAARISGLSAYAARWREAAERTPRLDLSRVLAGGAPSSG